MRPLVLEVAATNHTAIYLYSRMPSVGPARRAGSCVDFLQYMHLSLNHMQPNYVAHKINTSVLCPRARTRHLYREDSTETDFQIFSLLAMVFASIA